MCYVNCPASGSGLARFLLCSLLEVLSEVEKLGITACDERVSPLFEASERLEVFEVNGRPLNPVGTVLLGDKSLPQRLAQLREEGINTLICGAVGAYTEDLLTAAGIRVIPWICGPVGEVARAYVTKTLLAPQWAMPGRRCRFGRSGRRRGGRGRGRGPGGLGARGGPQ